MMMTVRPSFAEREKVSSPGSLSRFEEEDGDLSQVEVDEMLGFVSDVASEVTSDDAMPRGVVLFVELFLNVGGDVLLNVVLFQRLGRAVDRVLLHVLGHVRILDDCFSVRHDAGCFVVRQTVTKWLNR